jgi:hypothetical protein
MNVKIQPKQIQFLTLSSPSGTVNVTQGETAATFDLSPAVTGNFNFVGNLLRSGSRVHAADGSSTVTGARAYVLGGQSNAVDGNDNLALNARSSKISGSQNTIVMADNGVISESSQNNTILAGRNVTIAASAVGNTVIKDSYASTTFTSTDNNQLNISFDQGTNFVDGHVTVYDNFFVGGNSVMTGTLNVVGAITRNGSGINTTGETAASILAASGAIHTRLYSTGSSLSALISNLNVLQLTGGAQTASGAKTFTNPIYVHKNTEGLIETGSAPNFVKVVSSGVASDGSYVEISSKDSIVFLVDSDSNGAYGSINYTGSTNSSFVVAGQTTSPKFSNKLMVVDPYGKVFAKDTFIMNAPSYVPTSSSDANGTSGQCSWNSSYFYMKTGAAGWGRIAWGAAW